MRYRTKLFFAFFGLVFFTTLLSVIISYSESSNLIVSQIRSQLLSVAATASEGVDGDYIESVTENDQSSRQYQHTYKSLQKVRDINRRDRFFIKYLYIIRPNPRTDTFEYVIDVEDNPHLAATFGDVFPADEKTYTDFGKPFVDKDFTYDHWGSWLSAFGPITNSSGKAVAMLGVDMSAADVKHEMHILLYYGLISLGVSVLISLGVAHILSRIVTNSLSAVCNTVESIGDGDLSARIHLDTHDEFGDLAFSINTMAKGLEERERLKMGFARYVSGHVLDRILKSDVPANLAGERRKVTLLFSDIRGFTSLSEQLPPEQVVSILNEYFERMIEVIFRHNGTLDKFIGDGIMVEFGAPLEDEEQERHAVDAALEMQEEVTALCEKWKGENKPEIKVGIGIHTGQAVVGNVGSEVRMEYTAIGDTVNVASRIEQATKEYQKPILISSTTYDAVQNFYNAEKLGSASLKGREETIDIFSVTRKSDG